MAKVNKKQAVASAAGLPTLESLLMAPENKDKVPASIQSLDGSPDMPAALSEGEFVFSVPSIIALGEGSHEKGIAILNQIHEQLKASGKDFLGKQGIGAAQ